MGLVIFQSPKCGRIGSVQQPPGAVSRWAELPCVSKCVTITDRPYGQLQFFEKPKSCQHSARARQRQKRPSPPANSPSWTPPSSLFSVHGYDGVSMRRIADAAGVSKANIYHHFASKEALYFAIMRRSAAGIDRAAREPRRRQGLFRTAAAGHSPAHISSTCSTTRNGFAWFCGRPFRATRKRAGRWWSRWSVESSTA